MKFSDLPKTIKIFDTNYKIEYVDNPAEVDIHKRESLWGQIDFWTRTIRIYKNNRSPEDIWQVIWHEVLHGICYKMGIDDLLVDEKKINSLAIGINTIIVDNFIKRR
ncbi:MAG: hypothetical protein QXG00_07385 [Candidatus Woesearchaeota archaeon]